MSCLRIFLAFNWACICCLSLFGNAYYNDEDLVMDLIILGVFFMGEVLLIAEYNYNWLKTPIRPEPGFLSHPRGSLHPVQMVYRQETYPSIRSIV